MSNNFNPSPNTLPKLNSLTVYKYSNENAHSCNVIFYVYV